MTLRTANKKRKRKHYREIARLNLVRYVELTLRAELLKAMVKGYNNWFKDQWFGKPDDEPTGIINTPITVLHPGDSKIKFSDLSELTFPLPVPGQVMHVLDTRTGKIYVRKT